MKVIVWKTGVKIEFLFRYMLALFDKQMIAHFMGDI